MKQILTLRKHHYIHFDILVRSVTTPLSKGCTCTPHWIFASRYSSCFILSTSHASSELMSCIAWEQPYHITIFCLNITMPPERRTWTMPSRHRGSERPALQRPGSDMPAHHEASPISPKFSELTLRCYALS